MKIKIILFLMISFSSFAQEDHIWYRKFDLSGYVNKAGEELKLPENSRALQSFHNGYACIVTEIIVGEFEIGGTVFKDIEYHHLIIDSKGQIVLDLFDFDIDKANVFSNGLFAVKNKKIKKWGYIDLNGNWIIDPIIDNGIGANFMQNRVVVSINGQFILINKTGGIINDNIGLDILSYGFFYENRSVARNRISGSHKLFGFVDINGNIIVDLIYNFATDFSEKKAAVRLLDEGNWFFIDKNGKQISKIPEATYLSPFNDGYSIIQKNGKVGYINHDGKIVIPCKYDFVSPFKDGYAGVSFDEPKLGGDYHTYLIQVQESGIGTYGIIDKTGKMIIEPMFYGPPEIMQDGVAKVSILEGENKFYHAYIDIEDGGRIIYRSESYDR